MKSSVINRNCMLASLAVSLIFMPLDVFGQTETPELIIDSTENHITYPQHVAVDSIDRIIVTSQFLPHLQIFNSTGNFVTTFGQWGTDENSFNYPRGVAIDSNDRIIIVTDSNDHRIQIFDKGGTFINSFGTHGSAPGQFNSIFNGIAVDSNDRIIVADSSNKRILIYDKLGEFLRSFEMWNSPNDPLTATPRGVAVDSNDRIIVTDVQNHRVQIFDKGGTFIHAFGTHGSTPGQFDTPNDVSVDSDDRIIITDSGNSRIQIFSPITETNPNTAPTVYTLASDEITYNGATLHGYLETDGGTGITGMGFEWGTNATSFEHVVSIDPPFPSRGSFEHTVSGLDPGQEYYFRAWAENSNGKSFGEVRSFVTPSLFLKPTATFTHLPDSPRAADKTTFDAGDSSSPDGSQLTYSWYFYDSPHSSYPWNEAVDKKQSTKDALEYIFWDNGNYNVCLVVSSELGGDSDPTCSAVTVGESLWSKIKSFFTSDKSINDSMFLELVDWLEITCDYGTDVTLSKDCTKYMIAAGQPSVTSAHLRKAVDFKVEDDLKDLTYGHMMYSKMAEIELLNNLEENRAKSQEKLRAIAPLLDDWSGNVLKDASKEAVKVVLAGTFEPVPVGPVTAVDLVSSGLFLKHYSGTVEMNRLLEYFQFRGLGIEWITPYMQTHADLYQKYGSHLDGCSGCSVTKIKDSYVEEVKREYRQILMQLLLEKEPPNWLSAKANSPIDLRVIATDGSVTGMVDGVQVETIPQSAFDQDVKTLVVMEPAGEYVYQIVGTDDGSYGLDIVRAKDDRTLFISLSGVQIMQGHIHQYEIDWDRFDEEREYAVRIDTHGNEQFDQTFTNKMPVSLIDGPSLVPAHMPATFDASTSYDHDDDGHIVSYDWKFSKDWKFIDSITVSGNTVSQIYSEPGVYYVSLTVMDDMGAADTSFAQLVVEPGTASDEVPPQLVLPSDITAEAEGPDGAMVEFEASAVDDVDGPITPACTPASGSTFPLRTTVVECTAADQAGNAGFGSFMVIIHDTTAPDMSEISDITAEAEEPDGATIHYDLPTATDVVDESPAVECSQDSGSIFQLGQTTVTCIATDFSENSASTSFTVTIHDTVPPEITILGDNPMTVLQNLEYLDGGATAFDIVDGDLTGSILVDNPVDTSNPDTYDVTYTASDSSGNAAQATRTVIVQPIIEALEDLTTLAGSMNVNSNSLNQSVRLLTDNNPNNDAAVCGQLDAFINQVNANRRITAEQKGELVQTANQINSAIGC